MTVDHSQWHGLLQRYVLASADGVNRFAYARVNEADHKALKAYVAALERVAVGGLSSEEQQAFWINLYNALTVDVVLDTKPVASIREVVDGETVGPWHVPRVTVQGRALSLNDIEHGILRKTWRDPRVHYAINCASMSCPSIMADAFTGATLEDMLTQGARDYINHPRGTKVVDGKLTLSEIFSWYRRDFGASDGEVIAHIAAYAEPALKDELARIETIAGYDYDWSLNEAK